MAKVEQKREIKPVIVTTLDELKAALKPVLVNTPNHVVKIITQIKWQDDKDSGVDPVVGQSVDSTLGVVLIEGMEIVKRRIEAYEKMKKASEEALDEDIQDNLKAWDIDKIRFNVDNLIRQRLGGQRVGLRIRWKVKEGIFEFDPYQKKLYKVE